MKKVLITGASGLIGRAVLEELRKREYELWAVMSGRRKVIFPDGIHGVEGNLLDDKFVNRILEEIKPEICCHYAWALDDGHFQKSSKNLEWLETSIKLLRLFNKYGGEYFFFAGSSAEYGIGSKGFTEYEKIESDISYSLYGCSKLCFENIANMYCKQENVQFITGRYFSVYGPRDVRKDSALPSAISKFFNGETFVCKSPENLWDYVYVEDCAVATAKLIDNRCTGVYNIASGHPMTMRQIFTTVAKKMDSENLLEFGEDLQQIALTADTSRLKKDTGYECNTSFEDGIDKTIQWWKEIKKYE